MVCVECGAKGVGEWKPVPLFRSENTTTQALLLSYHSVAAWCVLGKSKESARS